MSAASPTHPNILLITTDQQRFDHLGVAGEPGIKTPHLDQLAQRGAWLRRAYCPSPICTPTRLSLLTGRYPSSHGGYSIGVTVNPFPSPTLPELLAAGGYATALVGKTHFVARSDEHAHIRGIDTAVDEDFRNWSGPYLGFGYVRVSSGHTINCIPNMHYREFIEKTGTDYRRWFPQMSPGYDNLIAGAWALPDDLHDTNWVAQESIEWLNRQESKPWFLWASFQDPHEPFVCPEPWFSQVDQDVLRTYSGPPSHGFQDRPDFYADVLKHGESGWGVIDDGYGVPCVFRWPRMDAQARVALQATAGMVRFLDHRIGQILNKLEATGRLENTIVIFTSDHGEMHGHHGYWGKGLMAFDDCQRVPLLISGPGVALRGACDALVNLVDLPRTILSLAGLATPATWQGVDLGPLLQNKVREVQAETFIECQATANIFQLTCVTGSYKMVLYRDCESGEFYDLANDPDQQENLWGVGETVSFQKRLATRLRASGRLSHFPQQQRKAFA